MRQLLVAAAMLSLRRTGLWIAGLALLANAAGAELRRPDEARRVAVETQWFAFHSDFAFNLYDAVLAAGTARAAHRGEAMEGSASECFDGLSQEERSAWDEAVDYYATNVASTWDFSRERYVFRSHLAQLPIELDADDKRKLGLGLLFLEAAAPAYRACRWPAQDAANRAWIAALVPRLEAHGNTFVAAVEPLFGRAWRRWPISVDVVETAGWAGADTVGDPETHIQISSRNPGYAGLGGLEMIFHEASHELVGPRSGPIAETLAEASRTTGVAVPRDLWHALLFVTVGEVARRTLAGAGEAGYVPYAEANGVFDRSWRPLLAPLRSAWLPYVGGARDRSAAARALLESLPATH
jgi:hypothetical protein